MALHVDIPLSVVHPYSSANIYVQPVLNIYKRIDNNEMCHAGCMGYVRGVITNHCQISTSNTNYITNLVETHLKETENFVFVTVASTVEDY